MLSCGHPYGSCIERLISSRARRLVLWCQLRIQAQRAGTERRALRVALFQGQSPFSGPHLYLQTAACHTLPLLFMQDLQHDGWQQWSSAQLNNTKR